MTKKIQKKKILKEFVVTFSTTGRGTATVMAETAEQAKEDFFNLDIQNDEQIEWDFDEVLDAEENI